MNIALCGLGRAGKVFAQQIFNDEKHRLALTVCREESKTAGQDVGTIVGCEEKDLPVVKLSQAPEMLKQTKAEVLIDFSKGDTSMKLLRLCEKTGVNLVICATEFTEDEIAEMREAGERGNFAICYAPNLTIGINLLMQMVRKLSSILPDFDFVIVERHRKEKAPVTTTAKLIAKAARREDMPILSVRAGEYVGIHEVTAANKNERISITHESFSREAFGAGAMLAAEFLQGRKGFFTMEDVINDLENNVLEESN